MAKKKINVLAPFKKLGNKFKLMKPKTKAKIVQVTAGTALLTALVGGSIGGINSLHNNQPQDTQNNYPVIEQSDYDYDYDDNTETHYTFDENGNVISEETVIIEDETTEEKEKEDEVVEETTTEQSTTEQSTTEQNTTEQSTTVNVENTNPTFIDSDGKTWTSEEEYLQYINGPQIEVSDYYIAPDGSYWESEQEYQNYINGLNNTNTSSNVYETTSTDSYSTDTYSTTQVETVDNTASYQDPYGNYWTSEQDYLSFVNGPEDTYEEDNYFVAPDGSYWESEQEYNEYTSGMTR